MEDKTECIMKIYASNTDMLGAKLFYEHIVYMAKENGVAGATVYRGIMGYGLSSPIHTSRFWDLTEKLPVVIEIVDETEKIEQFYDLIKQDIEKMPKGCLVTMEQVKIKLNKPGTKE
jgi:uncharacterized protein